MYLALDCCMPFSQDCMVGASPSYILYCCVSPAITWLVLVVVVSALATVEYKEMLTSPESKNTANNNIFVSEIISDKVKIVA